MTAAELTPGQAGWPAFLAALREAGLPTEDLSMPGQRFFAFEGGGAFGGFALSGRIALLRSLVVVADRRHSGLGTAALKALLHEIGSVGATEVWLLTTSASGFFERLGFRAMDRAAAPVAVTSSAQFSTLCPASAVLMCKTPV
jgi:N-acetylglutamate synthase-like GNAT family acetyltransferase